MGNPISIYLIEKVSIALHVSEERLRQVDTVKRFDELENLLKANCRTKGTMHRANLIATELVDISLGMTERCICYMNLGRAQFQLQRYDEAHDSWLKVL